MKRIGPAVIYVVIFILTIQVLFPHLMPTDKTLPGVQLIEGQTSYARQQWLDGLAFEVILDSTLRRFGVPMLYSPYLSGGTYIVGDPRDGTLSPLTWVTIFLSPLARMKAKILLALLAGFLSVVLLGRSLFKLGRTGSVMSGVLFLVVMRFWVSLIEHPLDAGLLFALPAMAMVWAGKVRARNAILAAGFFSLVFFQTGIGAAAAIVSLVIFWPALKLSTDNTAPAHPGRDVLLVLCFGILFACLKLFPMAEAFQSFRSFWVDPVVPTMRSTPLHDFAFSTPALMIKALFALGLALVWLIKSPKGATGAICLGSFAFLAILPDWGSLSGGVYGDSKWPGPIDSPERYFFPFFAFFVAISFSMIGQSFKKQNSMIPVFALIGLGIVVASSSIPFRKLVWEVPGSQVDITSVRNEDNSFFQIRTWSSKKKFEEGEPLHPALLAASDVGVVDPKMMPKKRFRVSPRFRVLRKPQRIRKVRSYRGEFYATSGHTEILGIEDWGNRLRFTVKSEGPGHIVINRNFSKNWVSDFEIENYRGQTGIKITEPVETVIDLRYRPFTFILGLFVSVFTIALAVFFAAPWQRKTSF